MKNLWNPNDKMTKTASGSRRIPPHEWIPDYFSPVVGILSTPEADMLAGKNNLSLVETLQPFSKLMTDVTLKDPEGANHPVSCLNVTFQDFKKDPSRAIGPRLLSDTVSYITQEPMVSRAFPNRSVQLEAPGFTPWFDAWTKLYLNSVPGQVEHEFTRHHLGCIFVAASNSKENPVEQLKSLVQVQHKHQHEKSSTTSSSSSSGSNHYPQYLSPHILKYYVLVHDVYAADEAKAQEIFTQMQNTFGSNVCHLLQINSRSAEATNMMEQQMAGHWTNMTFGHRFCHVETRLKAISGGEAANLLNLNVEKKVVVEEENHLLGSQLEHPLANAAVEGGGEKNATIISSSSAPVLTNTSAAKLTPATSENLASHLTPNDVDRIRILVREFVIKGLIPHVEKQMRLLQEIVTNRKSRSLFSGAKRWFGQSKPGVATGTSVIYGREAPELQIRKLGDLYFMLKLYKHAYNHYHTAKKDFQNDEAWNYYAGAAEVCALAQFMQTDSQKKYPAHYMEDSITKYLSVCQMPEFAVRATLFDAMCLKYQGMYLESALSYVRMTNEAKDLRSALLLEQAAYCYLLSNPPLVRKYAFHIILSGYRFSKSGQKKHSSRTYRQGFQVYKDHGWDLSEDHILYTLGHQSLLLKDHFTAASLFNELVSTAHPGLNPLQQMCHLREFFIVHHMREKEDKDKAVSTITIPTFEAPAIILDLSGGTLGYETLCKLHKGSSFQDLERVVMDSLHQHVGHKTCQTVFGSDSCNNLLPQAVQGERVRLLLPASNNFQTPLLLKKVHLLWKFVDPHHHKEVINSMKEADSYVETEFLDSVTLEKGKKVILELHLRVLKPGQLTVHGVEYSLKALFPQSESTDYTVRGKQPLTVQGPRLNVTKEHRQSKVPIYGRDNRLHFDVIEPEPRLGLNLTTPFPDSLYKGEVKKLELEVKNEGGAVLSTLYCVHNTPGLLSFSEEMRKRLYDFPLVTDPALNEVKVDGDVTERPLEILPVHIDNLAPGQVKKVNMWICGPEASGSFVLNFVYGGKRKRLLQMQVKTKVLPSVDIKAVKSRPRIHDNVAGHSLLVQVLNVGKLEQVYVSQISLVTDAKNGGCLSKFLSHNANLRIARNESAVFGLKVSEEAENISSTTTSNGFRFSSLSSSQSEVCIQKPPYVDFLKSGFKFLAKSGPTLKNQLCAIQWRSVSGSHCGFLFADVKEDELLFKGSSSSADMTDSNRNEDVLSTTESLDAPPLPLPKKPCLVHLKVQRNFKHDFATKPLLMVPFTILVSNPSKEMALFKYKADKDGSRTLLEAGNCRFLGCTKATVEMKAMEEKTLAFHVVVTAPGLYNFCGLRFQMTGPEDTDKPDEDELIPLEVSFVVEDDDSYFKLQ